MRIVHLDTGRGWRGGQAQVLFLLRGLRARGHESVLMAPAAPLLERARAEGLEAVRWRPRMEWDPLAIAAVARVVRARRADLVHAHGARAHAVGSVGAWLAGRPLVVSRRVPVAVGTHPLSALKYRRGVARYLCVSHDVAAALRRGGVEARRIAVVPSGVALDLDPGAGIDLRGLIGAPPQAPVIGTIASLTREKEHDVLLEALPAVLAAAPETRLVWIGQGERRAALEARRDRMGLGDRVHLLGFRADAPQLLRQFTLLALPSRFEGLGNAILEAQAAGIPVVATAVGGIPELIEDGVNGRLVPPHDPAALAHALVEALLDPERRDRWAARALETVRAFGVETMVDRTLEQYEAVHGERGRSLDG